MSTSKRLCHLNKGKEFASGLTSLLVKKIVLVKLCKCTKKLTLIPAFSWDKGS